MLRTRRKEQEAKPTTRSSERAHEAAEIQTQNRTKIAREIEIAASSTGHVESLQRHVTATQTTVSSSAALVCARRVKKQTGVRVRA